MPSFVQRITDRLDQIENEQALLEQERISLWDQLHLSLSSLAGKELFDKIDHYARSRHDQDLLQILLSQKYEGYPGVMTFDPNDPAFYGFPNDTELKNALHKLELAWIDFVRIEFKFEDRYFTASFHLLERNSASTT